jgi:hypothetical protein
MSQFVLIVTSRLRNTLIDFELIKSRLLATTREKHKADKNRIESSKSHCKLSQVWELERKALHDENMALCCLYEKSKAQLSILARNLQSSESMNIYLKMKLGRAEVDVLLENSIRIGYENQLLNMRVKVKKLVRERRVKSEALSMKRTGKAGRRGKRHRVDMMHL